MKIAVFGDIHGNLPALVEAYYSAMERHPEKLFHLGDVGGYAPYVNEVVDFLEGHGIGGVQGNYDDAVADDREHCGCRYENSVQAEMADLSFAWTKKHATRKSKDYMKALPFEISFSVLGKRIGIFHATPQKNNLYWHEDRPEKFFREMAAKADSDIMIYGHTHRPYRKDIGGKVFINAGSVGKPKDGDPRTCAAIVEITAGAVKTDFIRVPYDIDRTARQIIESGLPSYFADALRQGR